MSGESLLSYYDQCHSHIAETDYLQKRGISSETLAAFNIGYDSKFKTVVFPLDGESFEARRTESGSAPRYFKKGRAKLFNSTALESKAPIFVTEGIIDALSVIEAGGNAIALCSVNNTGLFAMAAAAANAPPPIIIALDNDAAGTAAAEKLHSELEKGNIFSLITNPYGEHKDANEALQKSRDKLRTALAAAVKAAEEGCCCKKPGLDPQVFLDYIVARQGRSNYETVFPCLNEALDGGLREELYVIGAVSSLGKTTLVNQIVDGLAADGHSVIYYSLEAGAVNIIAKSISRMMLVKSLALSGNKSTALTSGELRDISNFSQSNIECFKKAMREYSLFSKRIKVFERADGCTVEDIAATVSGFIKHTCEHPVVVVDYLQILDIGKRYNSAREATDDSIAKLKSLCVQFAVPVIVISSLNRQSYDIPVSLASFKESGGIEYTADVVIGLQFEGVGQKGFKVAAARGGNPRHIQLCILKSRNGRSGDTISYRFYPAYSYFEEDI